MCSVISQELLYHYNQNPETLSVEPGIHGPNSIGPVSRTEKNWEIQDQGKPSISEKVNIHSDQNRIFSENLGPTGPGPTNF